MEGLLLVLLIFAGTAVVDFCAVFLSALLLPVELLLVLLFSQRRSRNRRARSPQHAPHRASPDPPITIGPHQRVPHFRKLLRIFSVIGGLLCLILLTINLFFFEPVVDRVLSAVLTKKGIEVKHKGVEGNFFTGRISFSDLELAGKDWEVHADSVLLDFRLLSAFSSRKAFDEVRVKGFRGNAVLASNPRSNSTKKNGSRNPAFTIQKLTVEDAEMAMRGTESSDPPPIRSIQIKSLDSAGFRTRYAPFYLFFRSNIVGSVNGQPLSVKMENKKGLGRKTVWKVERLPVAIFHGYGKLFDMIEKGSVTLDVEDDWKIGERFETDMNWNLTFHDLEMNPGRESVLSRAVADFFNEAESPVMVGFSLKIDPENFEGSASDAAQELYRGVSSGVVSEIAKNRGVETEVIQSGKEKLIEAGKNYLDRIRK